MSLSDLRTQKKAWLNNTLTLSYIKKHFKLSDKEILQIESEVRYGQERYNKQKVKWYIDSKIDKQTSVRFAGNPVTKLCTQCCKSVNKDYYLQSNSSICTSCYRKNERKTDKMIDKSNEMRNRQSHQDQMPLL